MYENRLTSSTISATITTTTAYDYRDHHDLNNYHDQRQPPWPTTKTNRTDQSPRPSPYDHHATMAKTLSQRNHYTATITTTSFKHINIVILLMPF